MSLHSYSKCNMIYLSEEDIFSIEKRNIETIQERSSYTDASNLKKIKSWYNKFLKQMKRGNFDKTEIDNKIRVLEQAIKDMEKSIEDYDRWRSGQSFASSDQMKYAYKTYIPFNGIYRWIKNNDKYAGLSDLVKLFPIPAVSLTVGGYIRLVGYKNMLQTQIEQTKEAIEYLKAKKKELK